MLTLHSIAGQSYILRMVLEFSKADTTQGGGTLPPEETVTTIKLDIAMIDKTRKTHL